MALPPRFIGHLFNLSSKPLTHPCHTLEIYLDYACPFSAKIFNTIYTQLFPVLKQDTHISGRLQVIFRHQVQPWHPSSTLAHEAALAVLQVDGSKFWDFSKALFEESKSFYDVSVVSETRNQTYSRLATIAGNTGISESKVLKLLTVPDIPGEDGSLNVGNGVTTDLKLLIKMARQVGVHVSPTVLWDGVVEPTISSSWTVEQWTEWLKSKV